MAKQDVELQFKLIDGVSRGLAEIQKGVSGLGASLVKINAAADLTGKAFGAIKAVGGVFADQITGAGNFEDSLAALQAVTGATAEDFTRLRDAAVDASERTRFSSVEAADGLTELARAGYSANEAISVLNPTLAIAQGNNISVAQSAELLTTTLKQFGASATDAARFADILQATADGTSTSVEQMGLALSYVAPLARSASVSIEETSAIIGALADQGFRGERAGTALRNVFSALLDPSSKFAEALDAAGIKSRDFSEIIQILGKDTDKAKDVILALDSEARPAILSLVNSGGAAIGKLTKELQGAAGAAQRTSDILGATFNASLDRLGNSFENIRNQLLTPILQPLATEFQSLSAQLSDFAKTEQFALIVEQFRLFATSAIQYVGDAVRSFDFEQAAAATEQFVADAKVELAGLREALGLTLTSGQNFGDGLSAAFNASVAAVSLNLASLLGALGGVSDEAEALSLSLAAIGDRAYIATGDALGRIAERADKAAKETERLAREANTLTAQYVSAVGPLNAFGKSLEDQLRNTEGLAPAFDATRNSVMRLTGEQKKLTAVQEESQRAMSAASVASYEAQLRRLVVAQNELIQSGVTSGAEFSNYSKKIAETEAKIAALEASTKGATQATEQQIQVVKRLKQELQNLGDQQDNVDQGNKKLAKSNSQVSDSFGNIDRQSSSTAISLGNLTEAFVRQALESAGASKSVRDYLRTLNDWFAQGADEERALVAAIELRRRQNAELTEEDRIRQRIINQYGSSSRLVEELVQQELRLAEARKKGNDESERGIEIEQRRAGQAGGIGTQSQAQAAAGPGASTGRGAPAGASRGDSPINITINQNGATPETIREIAPLIERELGRLGALRR